MRIPKEALSELVTKPDGKQIQYYYKFSPCFCAFVKIYTLSDKAGNVFYVGCTSRSLEKRLAAHMQLGYHSEKDAKIKELNGEVLINLIEEKYVVSSKAVYAQKKMSDREQYWIKKYMALGYNLFNREAKKAERQKQYLIKSLSANTPATEMQEA